MRLTLAGVESTKGRNYNLCSNEFWPADNWQVLIENPRALGQKKGRKKLLFNLRFSIQCAAEQSEFEKRVRVVNKPNNNYGPGTDVAQWTIQLLPTH